jgi:DNA processing protein
MSMKVNKHKPDKGIFPAKLKLIPQPPKLLYSLGDIAPLDNLKVVSIVGSRAVTPYGRQVTLQLAGELAARGIAIVSGLALGVDALAHQAALEAGGYTVAVLPSSIEQVYPATNRQLAAQIVRAGGALISEYAGDMKSFRSNFVIRNRLVAGLSDVLLVTEASYRSGTLHTANFALEQGKTVMAIPGNITSSNSQGTNSLIKAGALPVTDVSDILQALHLEDAQLIESVTAASADEEAILIQLKQGVTDVNELQASSKLPPQRFSQTLTMMEITGKIHALGGGHWTIR